ncbi:PadR family transcriptional regulator [Sphaerisporangium sp. NPDC005288]|uniref:PadR family transcriptional regulator n=1 Tax=Sphaerisporangium sp. NPDC005288 TaxID=3155114 RepID=UPI0033AF3E69
MSLRIALLGLLSSSGPASGYDLTKKFEVSINHVWQAGHSQIYPELAKLAADGLVTVEAEGARGRKTYAVTPEGRAEVHRWMLEHVPAEPARSENALQAFLLPLLDAPEAVAVLERMSAVSRARLGHLYELKVANPPASGRLGVHALELGIMQTESFLTWAATTIDALRHDA